ncbi:transcriptional regulator with XRE-family HTH domain [Anoxybacillus voinovskiensis]|uniref:Transcriptional regulator with XRE-family HTH domain n=1 Tax=Anoxybacteroides voinovskiense TaxID=230470 RepID=A0A840DPI7_9BACL|nr:helix-turn-helix transcriptional regulator [Anoxybacillus voinovskiensis]MBB4075071.1 transcriptional regulator with XRE-family HTH domain [Anoxybacillus voinovskiensis]
MTKLADHLKYLRKQQNWTQEDVAQRLNMSRSQISKWETGETLPDLQSLEKLSDLYDVSIDFLIGRRPSKQQLLREVNRLYATDKVDETMLDIIDYLKQHPDMEQALHSLAQLPAKKRKHIESAVIAVMKEFMRLVE